MIELALTKGKVCLLNDEDFLYFYVRGPWHVNEGYARSSSREYLHNLLGLCMGLFGEIDHKDRNRLNNQRFNLRLVTHSQNQANTCSHQDSGSVYKGVRRHSQNEKWCVEITVSGHKHYLGCYECEVEAALAYDVAATKYFGEFANLNFSKV